MLMNAFYWQNFLESRKGREWVNFFAHLGEHYEKRSRRLRGFIGDWTSGGFVPDRPDLKGQIDEVPATIRTIKSARRRGLLSTARLKDWEDAEAFYNDELSELEKLRPMGDNDDYFEFNHYDVPRLSVALYCLYPKMFFPYYFYPRFYLLRRIFRDFGIFLPPVPSKNDFEGRMLYYAELCGSLRTYWTGLGFEPEHIPAFLYGFAPGALGLLEQETEELPKPRRAWFVGGGIGDNGDTEYLDQVDGDSRTIWQGNADTEPGDIIVMYCLAPRSEIHSIWRAERHGAVEPFRRYYNTIWMCRPQRLKPVSFTELMADPVMSKFPLVRSHMQGINGRQIPKEYYDRLLGLLRKKGNNTRELPQLEDRVVPAIPLRTERDVERRMLEPLLGELGFTPRDWERQVKLRVGRKERVIPDYVLFPARDPESPKTVRGAWVWEAKLSVKSNRQLAIDFEQAASYARLVGAKGVGLISREGVWISLKGDDYSIIKARHWPSNQLGQIDRMNELRELAGKRVLSGRS